MIGIVFMSNLKFCPYLDKYLNILNFNQIDYEVLFWNRENLIEQHQKSFKSYSYNRKSKLNKNPIFKITDYYFFGRWVKKMIKIRNYKKIIVLSTLSGIFISNILLKKYPGKYIFDIRDYSYENIKYFYKLEEKLIKESYFTCISSKGFENFLPKNYDYTLVHNFNYSDLQSKKKFKKKPKGSTLNIVWNGTIRYFEHQSSILSKLKNDKRFNLFYHGIGPEYEMYKKYCKKNNITNVIFTGEYSNSEKAELLADADILNNSYGTKKENEILYAISNKYYDGLIFSVPQLVEKDTYKHRLVQEKGVGIGLNVEKVDFADRLYEYYFSINEISFNKSCKNEIDILLHEEKKFLEKVEKFLKI